MKKRSGLLYFLPHFVGVSFFCLVPFAQVVRRSFFNVLGTRFTGWENYRSVLQNGAYRLALRNTGRFMLLSLPPLILLSLLCAVMLQGLKWFREELSAALALPMALPAACVVLVWRIFFEKQGLLNVLLGKMGGARQDWMHSSLSIYVLVISYLWKNLGYDMVLWLAGLSGIPPEIYEAARVDGAGTLRCFVSITLPNLKDAFFTISVLSLLNSFKVFREAYLVAGEYPHEKMYLLQHLYNNWFSALRFERVAAAAVLQALPVLILCIWLRTCHEIT